MDQIRRRGFMAGLAAFFGFAPLVDAGSGDVGDADIDGPDGLPKPKADTERQVVSCKVGDVIELECHGLRCRAIVQSFDVKLVRENFDISEVGCAPRYLPELRYCEIDLSLRSTGEVTMNSIG